MPHPSYWHEKINETISKPREGRAAAVVQAGFYIDEFLDYYKTRLSEDRFSAVKAIAEDLREYIIQNYNRKFKTRGYARKLASELKAFDVSH